MVADGGGQDALASTQRGNITLAGALLQRGLPQLWVRLFKHQFNNSDATSGEATTMEVRMETDAGFFWCFVVFE